MTVFEARDILRSIVAVYFGDGHVFFAESKMAKRPEPYITVKLDTPGRDLFAGKVVDDKGYQRQSRRVVARAEINLYTKGRNIAKGNRQAAYANTALNDMTLFLDFLESDEGIEEMNRQNIVILPNGQIRDLSALLNEGSQYQYRALLECDVSFTTTSYGRYGMDGIDPEDLPSDSKGGGRDMQTGPYVIDDAEIEGGVE